LQAADGAFSPEDPRARILEDAEGSPYEAAVAGPRAAVQCAQPVRGVFYGVDVSWSCTEAAAWAAIAADAAAWGTAVRTEYAAQAGLLRDIIGPLPFRNITLDPAWLPPTVAKLVKSIYEERAFDRLPALADALDEAGCTDADILGHLRGPGPHVKGCWALDALLGRE
jgi:hypothetical protein